MVLSCGRFKKPVKLSTKLATSQALSNVIFIPSLPAGLALPAFASRRCLPVAPCAGTLQKGLYKH